MIVRTLRAAAGTRHAFRAAVLCEQMRMARDDSAATLDVMALMDVERRDALAVRAPALHERSSLDP
jgi:hypothetical protein